MTLPLVLVVDDNPENLTVIGELLQPAYAVRAANSGARALHLARLLPRPDLVLLDVMMPDMDGYEVLGQLRQWAETADLPVIFLTALNSAADEERGLGLGAVDYITKPIRPPVLLARVRLQLEQHRLRQQLRERARWLEEELAAQPGAAAWPAADGANHAWQALTRLAQSGGAQAVVHARRTQAGLRLLALALRQLGLAGADALDDETIRRLEQAVVVHDVGMLALPATLLAKPQPLTAGERAVLQSHAPLGAAVLEAWSAVADDATQLQVAVQMARSHHERWDGAGYPDRLAGDAIPLPARLLAIVDNFCAMTTGQAWRPAMSPEQARTLIAQGRGTQFDPQLVVAFEACFDALVQAVVPLASDAG